MIRRLGAGLLLLVLPLSVVALAFRFKEARGPYWLGSNSDPEYAYLLNSLLLAELRAPKHNHHPGTPLQVLGACALKGLHRGSGSGPLRVDVIRRPEDYLDAIHMVLAALLAVSLTGVGVLVLRATGDWTATLLLQGVLFLCPEAFPCASRVHPEALLLSLAPLYAAVLYVHLRSAASGAARAAVPLGVLLGLGVATKVTALPLALIPLVVLEGRAARARFLAAGLISGLLGISPILPKVEQVAVWMSGLLLRRGGYGQGPLDVFRGGYPESLWGLLGRNPTFSMQLGLGLAVLIWVSLLRRKPGPDQPAGRQRRALAAVLATQALALLLVARQTYQYPRYLLPPACLFGLSLLLARDLLAGREARRRPAIWLASALVLAVLGVLRCQDIGRDLDLLEEKKRDQLMVVAIAEQRFPRSTKVYFFQSSSVRHALYFGNGYTNFAYLRELNRAYPDSYFYNVWASSFGNFGQPLPVARILERDPGFLLQGSTRPHGAWLPFPVAAVYRGKHESLFRLEGPSLEARPTPRAGN